MVGPGSVCDREVGGLKLRELFKGWEGLGHHSPELTGIAGWILGKKLVNGVTSMCRPAC